MISFKKVLSYRPIKLLKMAIFHKSPIDVDYTADLSYEPISLSKNDIVNSGLFKQRVRLQYDGFLFYDQNCELVGYYWYTIGKRPPTVIPKIPSDAVWIFNMLVFENYRGHGYQKKMLKHFESNFRDYRSLYSDIHLHNIPSIKSFLKEGYRRCGIYYVLIIGIRFRNLNVKLGYWSKTAKHKYKYE